MLTPVLTATNGWARAEVSARHVRSRPPFSPLLFPTRSCSAMHLLLTIPSPPSSRVGRFSEAHGSDGQRCPPARAALVVDRRIVLSTPQTSAGSSGGRRRSLPPSASPPPPLDGRRSDGSVPFLGGPQRSFPARPRATGLALSDAGASRQIQRSSRPLARPVSATASGGPCASRLFTLPACQWTLVKRRKKWAPQISLLLWDTSTI